MNEAEFDKFADEYEKIQAENIKSSGEAPEFFVKYKVKDTLQILKKYGANEFLNGELKILDFGAGIGKSIPFFRRYLPYSILTCMDVSRKSLAIGEKNYLGKAVFKTFDGRHIPDDDNTYHIVFSSCVFHHIQYEHHGPILYEIYRIIKPGGIIIVFEHNPYNPLTEHAVRTCAFDKNARLIKGKEFLKRLEKIGFINAILCYRIFFPGLLRIFRPMEKYMGWLPLGAQYYVSGRKPYH